MSRIGRVIGGIPSPCRPMGGRATGEGTAAWDLSCNGFESSYVVADVRMTAIRLDRAKLQ